MYRRFKYLTAGVLLLIFTHSVPAACLCGPLNSCNLTLDNQTVSADAEFTACETITIGPNLTVGPSATLDLEAGSGINMISNSGVEASGRLLVEIDPDLACSGDADSDEFNQCMDCNDFNGDIYPGAQEACDYQDNDCDGNADEDYADLNDSCIVGTGACASAGILVCDTFGTGTECNATEGTPRTEVCNSIDDDCDEQTDEDFTDLNQSCIVGTGACASAGIMVCDTFGTGTECNASLGNPGAESCNGIDDDCDGSIDDNLAAPACTALTQGVCAGSGKICYGQSGWQACGPANYGLDYEIAEVSCDGKDNDCDGLVDNEMPAPSCANTDGVCAGSVKTCGGESGWDTCEAVNYGTEYEAVETSCDGLDNDCDGVVDEGYVDLNESCIVGTGACQAVGIMVCSGSNTECNASSGTPGAESCNGIDDDCDGSIDDNLAAPACTLTQGVCAGSGQFCYGQSGWKACGPANYGLDYEIEEVSCDGKDNDCDGSVDEACD